MHPVRRPAGGVHRQQQDRRQPVHLELCRQGHQEDRELPSEAGGMIRRLSSLRRDERGAAIIELAIVAPVLALLTIGVVDMANGFATKLKLEQAAQRAIEKVMQTTGNGTSEEI